MSRVHRVLMCLVLLAWVGCLGPQATEPPFWFPRHPDSEAIPLGLGEGELEARGKCLYVGEGLLIWPDDYALVERDGSTVIEGGGWRIEPGDHIEFGGGGYDRADALPTGATSVDGIPCPGPYTWVSEVREVTPADEP